MDDNMITVSLAMPVYARSGPSGSNISTIVAFVYTPGSHRPMYFVRDDGALILNNFQVLIVGVKKNA